MDLNVLNEILGGVRSQADQTFLTSIDQGGSTEELDKFLKTRGRAAFYVLKEMLERFGLPEDLEIGRQAASAYHDRLHELFMSCGAGGQA